MKIFGVTTNISIYLDDIIISGRNEQKHDETLKIVCWWRALK